MGRAKAILLAPLEGIKQPRFDRIIAGKLQVRDRGEGAKAVSEIGWARLQIVVCKKAAWGDSSSKADLSCHSPVVAA